MNNIQQKAEVLASRLDRMNEHFDIVESTINECTDYVQSITIDDKSSFETLEEEDILKLMREDFMMVRNTILGTIDNGKDVVTAVNVKLTTFEESSENPDMINSFANLIKVINDSSKLLITLYSDIIKTQQLIENKKGKEVKIEGDVTINTIAGNISDIIKQIKG